MLNLLLFHLKKILVLSSDLHEIICGSILGDLHAEKSNIKGNTRLQFRYSSINEVYVNHLYSLFKDYCGTGPIKLSSFDDRINRNKSYNSIKFQTLSLPCFNVYRELFYNSERKKIIPLNMEELLTPRGLAHWIMDDGYKFIEGLYLCTESFNLEENQLLIYILKNKFNLNCGIHKVTNGNRIYIWKDSKEKLISLVKNFMIPHFYYKLDIS